ncbi:MAG: hypothetical protein ACREMF_11675 [Gemmatimonadales bacterium]
MALAFPPLLAGQGSVASELDVGPLAGLARYDFYGISAGVATRPGGQGRVGLAVAGGALNGDAAVRLETTVQFLVTPGARSGVSPYGGVGAAYLGSPRRRGAGALVVLIGVEAAAGGRRGWFGEVGLGGGLRLRLGYRWRHGPSWQP